MQTTDNVINHPLNKLLLQIASEAHKTTVGYDKLDEFKLLLNYFFEIEYNYRCQQCYGKGCESCNNVGYLDKPIIENEPICSICGHTTRSKAHSFECRSNHEVAQREKRFKK